MGGHSSGEVRESLPVDLVFGGGGLKVFGILGALVVLEDQIDLRDQRTAGTSAGSALAAFKAAKIPTDDIVETMFTTDFTKFPDPTFLSRLGVPGKLLSLYLNDGIYKGDYMKSWVADTLKQYGVETFGDLKLEGEEFAHIPEHKANKLVVVAADISNHVLVYLPWDYHKYKLDPDEQSVALAVRASMGLPYYYKPAVIGNNTYVDGGLLSNNAVDIFDVASPRWPTLGIKLSATATEERIPHRVKGLIDVSQALFSTMINGHDQRHLDDPCTARRTIIVKTGHIPVTNSRLVKYQKECLFEAGQEAALTFLEGWDYEEYKKVCV